MRPFPEGREKERGSEAYRSLPLALSLHFSLPLRVHFQTEERAGGRHFRQPLSPPLPLRKLELRCFFFPFPTDRNKHGVSRVARISLPGRSDRTLARSFISQEEEGSPAAPSLRLTDSCFFFLPSFVGLERMNCSPSWRKSYPHTLNTRSRGKRIYSWIGKAISTDKTLQISHYRGISINKKDISDICIFPGEFIFIEEEKYDDFFVARLLQLYEDGAQKKHAIIEWFSRFEEIPFGLRNSLGQKNSQEIFLNEKTNWDTDIFVSSIIGKIMVIPLSPCEPLPIEVKDKQVMFVRKSWDGKKLKPLRPNLLAELKNSVKLKNDIHFATECTRTPSRSLEEATENVTWSNKSSAEVKLRHSAAKSSLFKQRYSPKLVNGDIAGAKKRLQLNTPTKSTNMLAVQQDVLELLDCGLTETPQRSPLKRKVTFTGIKGSPKKISCVSDEEDLLSDIKPLDEHPERTTTNLLTLCQRIQDSSLKISSCAVTQSGKGLDEECELETRNPVMTPRSRRKCAQVTAARIAKQLRILNPARDEGKGKKCLSPLETSDSDSSDEEDNKKLHTPKRQTKFIPPKFSKNQSMGTPAKDPRNSSKPSTPKTPRNATPRIRSRNQTAQKPVNVLEEARMRLHVSAVPDALPCREKEFQDICNFIKSKLLDGTGGCMYISGVPGTGKTATVHEAIHYLQQAAENDEIPVFQFIEINGMKLTDPHQAYVLILKLLTGQKTTANHAAELLKKMFCTPGSKRKTLVLIVDELDLLWTRKQNVMYNLFDWPTQKDAKLIVLAIANTMDLPERMMMKRVASRLGLTRMSFQPYTYKQLQQIVSSRINQLKAFEEDAIQFISRKVAALSGDARRCLDICRRSTEICELNCKRGVSGLVNMAHVMQAVDEMFSSPYINAIRNASLQEQIFLKATIAEFHRLGLEEATIQQIFHQHIGLCRLEGLPTPTVSDIMAISSRLGACKLLLAESHAKYLSMRIRLNVSQNDVMYALKQD
ncbi:origin recognition complex subunit 1 isoform X2 [Thamnophis elegans]|uniref:origin recognition complex subunit 1 isoform X2 n=1 Tax=Thamnophis elegans TaxID=35005 RepID=UPI001378FD2E|nr:origin recognition complex subunit 1 isoform X2 [Thamnophis elegans]